MKTPSNVVRIFIGLICLSFFSSCDGKAGLETESPVFTLQEARSCFEKMIGETVSKADVYEPGRVRSRLSPGEYSPVWEAAESVKEGCREGYIVPIDAEYRIYSYTGKYGEKVERPWRRVRQELSVMKDLSTGRVYADIMSTIKKKGLKKGAKYSGVVVWTDVRSMGVTRVQKWEDEAVVEDIRLTGKGEILLLNCKAAVSILQGYQFFRNRNIVTKSDDGEGDPDGDDDEDDPFWNIPGNLEDWGGGLFYNPDDGSFYYDSDGDGVPDSFYLDPSVCNGGDGGGGGGGGGGGNEGISPFPGWNYQGGEGEEGGDDDWDDDWDDEGLSPEDEECIEVGRMAVSKMAADVNNRNISFYQKVGDVLTGVSLPASLNSIYYSVGETLAVAENDIRLLHRIGGCFNGVSFTISAYQTFIAFSDGDVTAGDIITAASTLFGFVACFSILNVPAGITSAVLGLVSIFVAEEVNPGIYQVTLENGHTVTFVVGYQLA